MSERTQRLLLGALGTPEARDELISNIETIDSTEIGALAVTTAKIDDLAVTNAKVATGLDAVKIGAGAVSNTEFSYLDGVTSAIQTQFTGKQTTTLADGKVLVGNGSNVATAVTPSGDASVSNAGVISINARKMLSATVGFAALNTATSGVAALFGTALPDNAVVVRSFYDVVTTFAGNGDDGSLIKFGIEDQSADVKASVAISNGANAFDAGLHEGLQVNTAASMVKLSAARQLAVTWTAGGTDTALTAGSMVVFLEYVQSI